MNGNESADIGTTDQPLDRLVYRYPEAGHILGGITRNTVKALVRAGELEVTRVGAFDMVTRESIESYIERGKAKARTAAASTSRGAAA